MRRLRLAGMVLASAAAAVLGLVFASPAGADVLPGNWIQNAGGSGMCLQPVGGSFDQGAAIEQVNCDKNTTLQRWVAFNFSSDLRVFQMRNVATGLCLDAQGGASDHTPVVQWTCNSISNEKWDLGPDFVALRSRVSGTSSHCLDVPAASLQEHVQMQLYRCTSNNSAQIWDESGPDPIIR
jgi:hypothetical protein